MTLNFGINNRNDTKMPQTFMWHFLEEKLLETFEIGDWCKIFEIFKNYWECKVFFYFVEMAIAATNSSNSAPLIISHLSEHIKTRQQSQKMMNHLKWSWDWYPSY